MTRHSLFLLVLLGACSSTGPSDIWQDDLDAARARWSAAGIADYDYRYRFVCGLCAPGATEIRAVAVRGGAVLSVRNEVADTLHTGDLSEYGMTGQFARIQRYIDNEAASLTVAYHPVLGYPESVSVDPIAGAIDDEHGYQLSDLVTATDP